MRHGFPKQRTDLDTAEIVQQPLPKEPLYVCTSRMQSILRKEVIQPHLPVRLPCYDFVPIASPTFDGSLHKGWATGFGCYRLS